MGRNCSLCDQSILSHATLDEEQIFCCTGCQVVFQILQTQNALDNFQTHPLFKQAVRSGLISNPQLLEEIALSSSHEAPEEEYKRLHLEINDMWCPSCALVICLILKREPGVRQCIVDYATDLASIEYTPRYITSEKILRLISQLGYKPVLFEDSRQQAVSRSLYLRFIVSAFCSLNVMMFAYPVYASYFHHEQVGYTELLAWLSFFVSLPVLIYGAGPIWRRFLAGWRVGVWGMETLVLMGVSAATALSLYELIQGNSLIYFDSMTVVIVFVLLGKIIESKAKFSAKDSLIRLTRALPRRGRKHFSDGTEKFVPLKEIEIGDFITVLIGERIVLDGIVVEGNGGCDESVMTGEAIPIPKKEGSTVLAGSLLQQGRLIIKVTAKPEETALHRIIQMVEQEIGYKSQYVRAADQIVKWFVPIVVVLASMTMLYCLLAHVHDGTHTVFQTAIIRAVSILLISCPCAIGIAAPLAEAHLLNALAKLGAIVRNRGVLRFLGKETVFIFDKTGTITEGKYRVISGLEGVSLEDLMALKGLVFQSNHPIAMALNQAIQGPLSTFQEVEEIVGKGMRGRCGGITYLLGSADFVKIPSLRLKESSDIQTEVFFVKNEACLSTIVLGDQIRPEAKGAIASLKGISTQLISGDSALAVEVVAKACNFTQWHAGCHPLKKRALLDELRNKGEIVGMVGDGINDAPALTAAHVGIAVVSATDVSIQVSDILLTTDKLSVLAEVRRLARKGHKIVKQNLFWAFIYNIVGMGLAVGGLLTPFFAAFAMVTSSLIVLLNAQRIKSK